MRGANGLAMGIAAIALLALSGCAGKESGGDRAGGYGFAAAPPNAAAESPPLAPSRARVAGDPRARGLPACGGDDISDMFYQALPYKEEGLFVQIPGVIGAVPFAVVGVAVSLPVALVLWPFDAADVAIYPLLGFPWFGYCVVATPFWIVKQVFWDGPCAFGRFLNLAFRSRKGQVDYLVGALPRYEGDLLEQACRKLEKLAGVKKLPVDPVGGESWAAWWGAHRDEFDPDMKPVKPAAPAPSPAPATLPVPGIEGATP
jgi:hypothetical protein